MVVVVQSVTGVPEFTNSLDFRKQPYLVSVHLKCRFDRQGFMGEEYQVQRLGACPILGARRILSAHLVLSPIPSCNLQHELSICKSFLDHCLCSSRCDEIRLL